MEVQIPFALAFAAGLVSFLSPCVLPVVPSYVAFVSGLTLGELSAGSVPGARRTAVLHSVLFMVGFGLIFMTMGTAATALGAGIAGWLPWLSRIGGALVFLFGLHLMGLLRVPTLLREGRFHLRARPVGAVGSVVVGMAFGAGWTPCIGPVLGSILLYAGLESTTTHGTLLLGTYALGLGIPFVVAAAGLNWFLAVSAKARRWVVPLQRAAGTVLAVIGLLMVTGRFASLTAFLAGMGQLINLDMS
jgi:cytochrome c-type biogenesis protein